MKSYTDLEQSKKLAEILQIESADMCWQSIYNENHMMSDFRIELLPYRFYSGISIPAWSLTALLDVLHYPSLHKTFSGWRCDSYNKEGTSYKLGEPSENPIDTCVEMILKLNELNLL